MGDTKENEAYEEELLDYEEEDEKAPDSVNAKVNGESVKKGYVGIHSSGFRDFLLKPELLRAIVDSGFEHPSEGSEADKVIASQRKKWNGDGLGRIPIFVSADYLSMKVLSFLPVGSQKKAL